MEITTVILRCYSYLGEDETLELAEAAIGRRNCGHADLFKSFSPDEFKKIRPIAKQDIEDAMLVGTMEKELVQYGRIYYGEDRIKAAMRHYLSLHSCKIGLEDVRYILNTAILEEIMTQ
jgi:hypothetical protein